MAVVLSPNGLPSVSWPGDVLSPSTDSVEKLVLPWYETSQLQPLGGVQAVNPMLAAVASVPRARAGRPMRITGRSCAPSLPRAQVARYLFSARQALAMD